VTQFVQDLAGLGVPLGFDRGRLRVREVAQNALGDVGIHPQRHERRDQRVAAERRREPGNARIRIGTLRRVGDEHVQVRDRAPHDLVEHGIGAHDARGPLARFAQRVPRVAHAAVEHAPGPFAVAAVRHPAAYEYAARRTRFEDEFVHGAGRGERLRRRSERQVRGAFDLIESEIGELDAVIAFERRVRSAARLAMFAANLEQIREVRFEAVSEAKCERLIAVVAHQQTLVACAVPHEHHAVQMDVLAPHRDLAVGQEVGIAEIRREYRIIVLGHRAQQQRPPFLEQELKLRQHARIAVINPFRVAGLAADVAAVVDDREGVAVLERAGTPLLQGVADRNGILRGRRLVHRVRIGRGVGVRRACVRVHDRGPRKQESFACKFFIDVPGTACIRVLLHRSVPI
jgi:hypothetical protein